MPPNSGRKPAGPGRVSRARVPSERGEAEPAPSAEVETTGEVRARKRRRIGFTGRALALGVVLLMLAVSYATSLRIYFAQSAKISETKADISARKEQIAGLRTEIDRWNDPAYIATQARIRLGWVLPGETGYIVIGPDGKPVGGGAQLPVPSESAPPSAPWWQSVAGSMRQADNPAKP